jgi:peptide chain release factor 1
VAVLEEPTSAFTVKDADIEWTAQRGSGPGGQQRNKTESAVLVRHKPTWLTAYCQSERSQHHNRTAALAVLRARIWEQQQAAIAGSRAAERRQQIGSGMRGDKRRTIREKDGQVTDHITGQRWQYDKYRRGEW